MSEKDKREALIDDVLSNEDVDDPALLELERLGDAAFDEISRRMAMKSLPPTQQEWALRVLARLTRQNCAKRKEEVLDLALENLKSDNPIVRSGAVNTAIWSVLILEGNPGLVTMPENLPAATPSLRDRVKAAVGQAVQRGVDEKQARFARRFMAR